MLLLLRATTTTTTTRTTRTTTTERRTRTRRTCLCIDGASGGPVDEKDGFKAVRRRRTRKTHNAFVPWGSRHHHPRRGRRHFFVERAFANDAAEREGSSSGGGGGGGGGVAETTKTTASPVKVSPFQDVADAMTTETMTKRDDGLCKEEEEEEEEETKKRRPRLTKENVDEALEEIRPYVINDGGNIEVVGVSEEDGVVAVRLLGACASCASSQATMKGGVESVLRKTFGEKQFKEVINVNGDVGQAPPELTKDAVRDHLKSIQERVRGYGGVVKCLEVDGRKGNVVLGFRGPKPLAAATAQSLQKTFPFIKTASLKELDDDDDDDDTDDDDDE